MSFVTKFNKIFWIPNETKLASIIRENCSTRSFIGSNICPIATTIKGKFISVPCASDITPFKAFALPNTIIACLNDSSTIFFALSSTVNELAKKRTIKVKNSKINLFMLVKINVFMRNIIQNKRKIMEITMIFIYIIIFLIALILSFFNIKYFINMWKFKNSKKDKTKNEDFKKFD